MMRKILLSLAALTLTLAVRAEEPKVKITVKNPTTLDRAGEMVEVDAAKLSKRLGADTYVVTDADGREIPSQLTHDGKLIFQVGVGGKSTSLYYVQAGTPAPYEPLVFGRQYPERVDDIAWENDRVAFRCYGPALQRSGERAWGYDIWNKRTSRLVVDERYKGELDPEVRSVCDKLRQRGAGDVADDVYNAVSYHVDHGTGMDCYKVGPTLGAGTPALLTDGGATIVYPRCYKSFRILDEGPLRFTVELRYETRDFEGQQATEVRTVSLDAGSQLNKSTVRYEGLSQAAQMAVGIVVHNENPTAFVLNAGGGYMGYEDLGDPNQYKEKYRAKQNKDFGKIYVGCVFTTQKMRQEYRAGEGLPGACGHILGMATCKPGATFTYYFGAGWSRNPETGLTSLAEWESYLSRFAQQVRQPLKVSF